MELYHHSYVGRKMPSTYFKHRLLISPYGKPLIFLMKFENQIVGLYAIHPMKIKIKRKELLAGYSYLTMTHNSHSGKGIFTRLSSKTFEEAAKKKYDLVYGFANKNSYPVFTNKLGFIELKHINFIKIKFQKFYTGKSNATYHKFPSNLDQLWKQYIQKEKFLIKIDRTKRFIDWRYKNNPTFKYYTLHKSGEFFFIFKKYENVLHIIDFFMNGKKYYNTLFTEASNLAKQLSCKEVSMWLPKNHEIMNYLGKNTFEKKQWKDSYFIVKLLNKKLSNEILEIKNWHYTMGDADHF